MRRRRLVNKKSELSDRGLDQYRLIQANCALCWVCCSWMSSFVVAHITNQWWWGLPRSVAWLCYVCPHTWHKTLNHWTVALKVRQSGHMFVTNPSTGKVITKLNFNSLFSSLRSLIPTNIIAGFRRCGVYLYQYNPAAIHFQKDEFLIVKKCQWFGPGSSTAVSFTLGFVY